MSDPSSSPPQSGEKSEPGAEERQKAAEELKKAGQRVAESGEKVGSQEPSASSSKEPSASSSGDDQPPELPQDPMMPPEQGPSGEIDPLMPESEESSQSESEVFADSDAEPSAGSNGEPSAGSNGEPSADELMTGESGGLPGDPTSLGDEIRAAQEALEQAGIALQTAGETLGSATTEGELAAAEEALENARIAIIVAGQDLISARGEGPEDLIAEGVFNEAEDALNDANVAIVIATDTLLSSRIEIPDLPPMGGGLGEGEGGGMSELDKELSESLVIFEGELMEARQSVINSTPPPKTNESIPGKITISGASSGTSQGEDEPEEEGGRMQSSEEVQQGRMPGEKEPVTITSTQSMNVPEDIPDPQGDDIVAQQLREAAAAETDPDLQAKLWEEYKRYRAGL